MPTMFNSFADVEAYVRQDPSGNGKAMLQLQLAMGESLFGGDSAAVAAAWIAHDDLRLATDATARREKEDRDLRSREVKATEAQAASAREATRIAWLALAVSVVGVVIAIVALIK